MCVNRIIISFVILTMSMASQACNLRTLFYNDTDFPVTVKYSGVEAGVVEVPAHDRKETSLKCQLVPHEVVSLVSGNTDEQLGFEHAVNQDGNEVYHIYKMMAYRQDVGVTPVYDDNYKNGTLARVNGQAQEISDLSAKLDALDEKLKNSDVEAQKYLNSKVSTTNDEFKTAVANNLDSLLTTDKMDLAVRSYRNNVIKNTPLDDSTTYFITSVEKTTLDGAPVLKIGASNGANFNCDAGSNDGPAYIKLTTVPNKNMASILMTAYSNASPVKITLQRGLGASGDNQFYCYIRTFSTRLGA